jgi:hypothetical protein
VRVAPEHFDISPEDHSEELHRLTGGLYRLLCLLLLEACRTAWPTKVQRRVSIADVRRAYQSSAYASQRVDVETLQSIDVNARDRSRRLDLVCPFQDLTTRDDTPAVDRTTGPAPAALHAVESALTVDEHRVLKELRNGADRATREGRKSATVTTLPRRSPLTAQALLAGEKLLSQPKLKGVGRKDGAEGTTEQSP